MLEEVIGSGTSMEGIDRRRFGSGLFFRLRFLVSLTNGNDKNAFIFLRWPLVRDQTISFRSGPDPKLCLSIPSTDADR